MIYKRFINAPDYTGNINAVHILPFFYISIYESSHHDTRQHGSHYRHYCLSHYPSCSSSHYDPIYWYSLFSLIYLFLTFPYMHSQFYIWKHKGNQVIRCRLTKYIFFPFDIPYHGSITYVNPSYTMQSEMDMESIPALLSLVASINPSFIHDPKRYF